MMRRRAVDCSIIAVAARVSLAEDGRTCREARVAIGAAAPNPFRARQAEAVLAGEAIRPLLAREAAHLARAESKPIRDVRASAGYRSLLVETLVERAVLIASQRASEWTQSH
jgi:CO/xanthine dehydrogenase FAD-binding subunit